MKRIVWLTVGVFCLVALMLTYIVQPVWVRRAPSARTAEGTRLRETVARLDGFAPRDHDHVENLDAAAKFLSEQMRSAGATVEVQEYRVGARTYRNVIGSFGPDQGERLVVGAHYDVFGGFSGADDNTSGVAALLALAESLGKKAPAKRVDLVAYTLEEPPYFRTKQMGSWVHANSLRDQGVKLVAMISIEMVGYFSDKPGSQNYPAPGMGSLYGDRADFIAVVGNVEDPGTVRKVKAAMAAAADLPVNSINAPRSIEGIDFSDHSNYWDAGYRAVMVTDTSFFRNPHYHTADDRPATLDYDRMAVVVQQLEAAVRALAR